MGMQQQIEAKITANLAPTRLAIVNESHRHNVPAGAETHWNVIIVSSSFEDQPLIRRQQTVYQVLSDEMKAGIHALTMKTLTPSEWEAAGGEVTNPAPPCRGGSSS